jgi:hypothetical protein
MIAGGACYATIAHISFSNRRALPENVVASAVTCISMITILLAPGIPLFDDALDPGELSHSLTFFLLSVHAHPDILPVRVALGSLPNTFHLFVGAREYGENTLP